MKLNSAILAFLLSAFAALPTQGQSANAASQETEASDQAKFEAFIESFSWQDQGTGELKDWATIDIQEGYRFLNGEDTNTLMQAFGNLPDTYEGLIAVKDLSWFVIFQFEDSGYVKDDEKDQLDSAKLLKQLQDNDQHVNDYRREQGIEPLYTEGWAVEPRYNVYTNNLEWGIILRSESGQRSVNYKTKLLGRNGIMNVTLVCDPSILQTLLPSYQDILAGHNYKPGKTYAEYRSGDKVATYGLAALIAGGAIGGAAKLGLLGPVVVFFKKFFKFIIIGVIAAGAAIKKFFFRIARGKESDTAH